MKIENLQLKPGDVIQSKDGLAIGHVRKDGRIRYSHVSGESPVEERYNLTDCFQLLQSAPVLGEAVKWHSPSEELPDTLYAGDRVLIVTMERERADWPVRPELVVIRAEENGWSCRDEVYDGYGPTDGVAWITEKELLKALPLPALPPEPSLREKIISRLKQSFAGLIPDELNQIAGDLEALIGGSDE